jgi:hypothetical protein
MIILRTYELGDLPSDFRVDTVSGLSSNSFVLAVLKILSNGGDGLSGLVGFFIIVLSRHVSIYNLSLIFYIIRAKSLNY